MASVSFSIATKKDPANIYVRFRDGRKLDLKVKTGKTISPKHWGKGKPRRTADFADKLNLEKDLINLKNLILTERNEAVRKQTYISRAWIERVISKWKGDNVSDSDKFISCIEYYRDNLKNKIRNNKQGVSSSTLKNYNTTISRIRRYESDKKTTLTLFDIDLNFHSKYLDFAKNKLSLLPNSINKDISQIKAVIRDFKERGYEVNEQALYSSFNAPKEKRKFYYTFNFAELKLIKDYTGKSYLENVRDAFIIGFWTGMRNGDWIHLKPQIVKNIEGRKILNYTQNKTGKEIKLPLHEMVIEIYNKKNAFPKVISNQKFNKYLKELCKTVGIKQQVETRNGYKEKWEVVASHDLRRSFATFHYNHMPNKSIMAITGHTTEKQFLEYIGEVETEHINQFYDVWENHKELSFPIKKTN